jgi:hypothetical protein
LSLDILLATCRAFRRRAKYCLHALRLDIRQSRCAPIYLAAGTYDMVPGYDGSARVSILLVRFYGG